MSKYDGENKLVGALSNVKNTSSEIRCTHCEEWFKAPIQFGNQSAFWTSSLVGNNVSCGNCGKVTPCNKENMRFGERDDDGVMRFYTEGKDTIVKKKR